MSLSIIAQYSVDPNLPKPQFAHEVYKRLVFAKKTQEVMYLVIGKLLKEIRDQKLYQTLDYESFNQFLNSEEVSFSKESAFMYIRVYEHYIEFLELDEGFVETISISKLYMMLPIIKKLDTKEEQLQAVEEMSALRYNDFIHEVRIKMNEFNNFRPTVYFSKELEKWIVSYYPDKTLLQELVDKT